MADRPTPNRLLRAVREAELQMSREEFAKAVVDAGRDQGETVACSARLVAAWEDGDVRAPRPVYRRILTAMTGRTISSLGFHTDSAPASPGAVPAAHRWPRRDVLTDGMAAAVALSPLGSESGRQPGRVGMAEVRAVDRAVAAVYAHDHDHGSAALRNDASEALRTAYQWLHEGAYTERTGQRLRLATGHLTIAAGWLSYDSGRPGDARSLYGEALAAARIADDRALEAHAFGCLSLLAKAAGRPREAIAAAQGAQSVARTYGSPRLLSLMAMREAGGWALMCDRSAADRAIVRAHDLYAKGPGEADPGWLEFFVPAELAGLEALARADLGQHERAAAGAEQAVLLHGATFARNRALYVGDIAIQHAVRDRPDPEAAAEAAARALAHLPTVRSDRLLQQLHNVESALQRHAAVPAVADWLEQYRVTTDVS